MLSCALGSRLKFVLEVCRSKRLRRCRASIRWTVITIISREFLITGLRLLASSTGNVLPAEKLGKHKTAWQMITILYFLSLLAWKAPAADTTLQLSPALFWTGTTLVTLTVALTIFSGLAYFWKNRSLLVTA